MAFQIEYKRISPVKRGEIFASIHFHNSASKIMIKPYRYIFFLKKKVQEISLCYALSQKNWDEKFMFTSMDIGWLSCFHVKLVYKHFIWLS